MLILKLYLCMSALLLVVITTIGCGYQKALTPAEPKGFIRLKDDNLASEKVPFQYLWQDPKSKELIELRNNNQFTVYVAPVRVDYLDFADKPEELKQTAHEIAKYLREQIIKKTKSKKGKYRNAIIVDRESAAETKLEIALTEIGLGSPLLYTGAWLLPLPGTGTAVDSMHQPLLAIEARLIDQETKRSIAELADRKIPKIRILDLNKVTSKKSPLKDISNNWAEELSSGLHSRLDKEKVASAGSFTLIPW